MAENESISNPQYFEGVEKLLEIWFTPNPSSKNADLRKIPRYLFREKKNQEEEKEKRRRSALLQI